MTPTQKKEKKGSTTLLEPVADWGRKIFCALSVLARFMAVTNVVSSIFDSPRMFEFVSVIRRRA